MSKKKQDNRKQITIHYEIDENRCVSFTDPCCEDIPVMLFTKIMKAISKVEEDWNNEVTRPYTEE